MTYTGTYALVLVLHLLTVAFVVGPAAVAGVLSARQVRLRQVQALHDAARTTRLYTLASLLTVLLGSALVGLSGGTSGTPRWSLGQLWVSASYVLWAVAAALVLAVVVPAQTSAAETLTGGGAAEAQARRIGVAAGMATLCYAAVVVLMVVKPGA